MPILASPTASVATFPRLSYDYVRSSPLRCLPPLLSLTYAPSAIIGVSKEANPLRRIYANIEDPVWIKLFEEFPVQFELYLGTLADHCLARPDVLDEPD